MSNETVSADATSLEADPTPKAESVDLLQQSNVEKVKPLPSDEQPGFITMSTENQQPAASKEELISPTDNNNAGQTSESTSESIQSTTDAGSDQPLDDSMATDKEESQNQDEEKIEVDQSSSTFPQGAEPSGDDPDNISNSKGAKILMTRFSSWKKNANEGAQTMWKSAVIPENAKTLWKQTPSLTSSMPRLQKASMLFSSEKSESTPVTDKAALSPDAARELSKSSSLADSSIGDESDEVSSDGDVDDTGNEIPTTDTDGSSSSEKVEPRVRVGVAFSKASTAASVVAESVATGFRGRYSGKAAELESSQAAGIESTLKPSPDSQTDLILKSRAGQHMQEILDGLEDHEFAMLLGSGMLGVNLKQCYLKNHGVFVDFLVVGGQAESSGIVRSGDLIVRVGDVDLRKGTILEIPKETAKAHGPFIFSLSTGTKTALERINYVDVSVAMMHRARAYYFKRGTRPNPASPNPTNATIADDETNSDGIRSICESNVPLDDSADCFVSPPAPTLELRKEFEEEVALR